MKEKNNGPLKKIFEATDTRQKQVGKRSSSMISENFEPVSNTKVATKLAHRPAKRRGFLRALGFAVGAVGTGLLAQSSANAATLGVGRVLTVGSGGYYKSLHAAAAAAAALNPSESSWVLISMTPGVYDLSTATSELLLPDYTELTGLSRSGCCVIGSGNNNIRVNAHNRISNCTIKYTGTGDRSAAVRQQETVRGNSDEFLAIDGVDFDVYDTHRSAIWVQMMRNCFIRNCYIKTSGIGIQVFDGMVFVSGTHCRLVGNTPGNTEPHIAVQQKSGSSAGYSRIWIDGGTWSTGYGQPEIEHESGAPIVIFQAKSQGRLELNNVWSIARNETGAYSGVKVTPVDVEVAGAWVRVRGGYYQSEDTGGLGMEYDLMNSGGGRLEIQGARYKTLYGDSYSSNGAGVRRISGVETYSPAYNDDGIKVVDASDYPSGVTVKLSAFGDSQILGSEQVIVRIDNSGNPITIDGNGKMINGMPTRSLGPSQYGKIVLRFIGDPGGWIVVSE